MGKSSNRIGKEFEEKLNKQFEKYKNNKEAYIVKFPTEWIVVRAGAKIIKAFTKDKSPCLDYIGLLPDGKGIVFEAKTTKNKTNFPLNNIQEYQYKLADELLEYVQSVFYIIEFRELNEIYLVHSSKIKEFINNNERKSIPIDWFRDKTNATLMQDLDILKYLK